VNTGKKSTRWTCLGRVPGGEGPDRGRPLPQLPFNTPLLFGGEVDPSSAGHMVRRESRREGGGGGGKDRG
jgi:hypothetical protein